MSTELTEPNFLPQPVNIRRPVQERDRITAHFCVYHEHCCDGPMAFDVRFGHFLGTVQQPYQRRLVVKGGQECKVDMGWLQGQEGMLCIQNTVKHSDKPEENEAHTIYIGFDPFCVRPGHVFVSDTAALSAVYLRSDKDVTFNLLFIPV